MRPWWAYPALVVLALLLFERAARFNERLIAHAWIPATLAAWHMLAYSIVIVWLWNRKQVKS